MNPDDPSYEQKMESRLKDWAADVAKLKERAENASPEIKRFCLDRVTALEAMERDGFAKLRELKGAGDDDWEAIRTDLETHWDEMRKTFRETYEKLR